MIKNGFSGRSNIQNKRIALLRNVLLITSILSLFMATSATAQVYLSDNFDNHSSWDGCSDPPSPWASYFWNSGYCNSAQIDDAWPDAHGNSGKSLKISWTPAMLERGLFTWAAEGKTAFYTGFWWRHNAGWNWGGDRTHKWFYGPKADSGSGGNRPYFKMENRPVLFDGARNQMEADVDFNSNDDAWHSVVIYMKHNSDGNSDGEIKMWWDGREVNWGTTWATSWSPGSDGKLNTGIKFGSGSTWTDFLAYGFQSRPDWGSGNKSYFDDIIIASTKAEVDAFLGQSETVPPSVPSNTPPVANAGNNLTVMDTDGSGFEQIQLDGSSSSDPDGSIVAYEWKEGSTVLATSSVAAVNLSVGTHPITLTVSDDNGAKATDTVNVTIEAATTGGDNGGDGGTTGDVLLQESFDNASTTTRDWYDGGAASPSIATDPVRGKVLEYAYPSGSETATIGTLRHLFPESDEVTITYQVKYQAGWEWASHDYGPHEMYLLTNMDHAWKGPAQTHGTTYIEMHGGTQTLGFQDGLNIDQNQIGKNLINATENRGVFGCNGSSDAHPDGTCWNDPGNKINGKFWEVNMSPIQNDRWYQIKVHLKMNSIINGIGVADGIMEYWIDGVKKMSLNDIMIRTGANPNMKWNQIMLAPWFHNGTPKAQKFWIDDLLITDAPVNQTPSPSAPTGLRINQ